MALVAHTIVSRYTPQQREPITEPISTEDDPWQTESSFGPAQRLHSRAAPYFVAASLEYDEYGMPKSNVISRPERRGTCDAAKDVSSWYRSLTSKGRSAKADADVMLDQPSSSSSRASSSSLSLLDETTTSQPVSSEAQPALPARARSNWFTSYPPADTSCTTFAHHSSKPFDFADLLSRNPPPLPSQPAFKPPVFLTLGPGNKGFTMLQRQGWREGEGLGSGRAVRRPREGLGMKKNAGNVPLWAPNEERKPILKRPAFGSEYATTSTIDAQRDVIDLTVSDSESDGEPEVYDLTLSDSQPEDEDADEPLATRRSPELQPHGTTLLTPITTTLKADRLGIGLKAVRRSSTGKAKAITHTPSALAAHIRSGNQMRKEKARHGRGSRGFARSKRKEERERVGMLAYMNS